MVIKSHSSSSAFNVKNIDSIGFEVKFDKNNKPIKRNGAFIVDKTKLNILFASGHSIILDCVDEKTGQEMFDTIYNAMQGIVTNK